MVFLAVASRHETARSCRSAFDGHRRKVRPRSVFGTNVALIDHSHLSERIAAAPSRLHRNGEFESRKQPAITPDTEFRAQLQRPKVAHHFPKFMYYSLAISYYYNENKYYI